MAINCRPSHVNFELYLDQVNNRVGNHEEVEAQGEVQTPAGLSRTTAGPPAVISRNDNEAKLSTKNHFRLLSKDYKKYFLPHFFIVFYSKF